MDTPAAPEGTNVPATTDRQPLEPQRYTFDNGEYVPVMDILYPPETVFFVKHPDGTFTPEGDAGLETTLSRLDPANITLDQMISTAKSFLEKHGYVVNLQEHLDAVVKALPPDAEPNSAHPAHPLLDEFKAFASGHLPSHGLIARAHEMLEAIRSKL